MKTTSPNLSWTLRNLVGTRIRFIVLFLCQCVGFILTILHLGLTGEKICDLAVWGLFSPLLFLVTLRFAAVEFQKGSDHEKPSA